MFLKFIVSFSIENISLDIVFSFHFTRAFQSSVPQKGRQQGMGASTSVTQVLFLLLFLASSMIKDVFQAKTILISITSMLILF